MIVRVVLLIECLLLASCDQFARVGTLDSSSDAMPPAQPSADGGAGDRDAAVSQDGGRQGGARCPPVTIAVCNPVKNQGCSGAIGMQCAIDYAATLAGYCIFDAPPAPGMPAECLNTGVTESCPATFTCFADRCEKICLCDADCDAGRCCTQPIEATGFSVCSDC